MVKNWLWLVLTPNSSNFTKVSHDDSLSISPCPFFFPHFLSRYTLQSCTLIISQDATTYRKRTHLTTSPNMHDGGGGRRACMHESFGKKMSVSLSHLLLLQLSDLIVDDCCVTKWTQKPFLHPLLTP